MSPCGMIMDMATELRVARMQLTDDPDDWVWVRLYRCRDGAKVRPGPSAFANPLWDDTLRNPPSGPHVALQPSFNRPWTRSPFPGLHFRGRPEWFLTGLPKSERQPGPVGPICGGENWDTELTWNVATDTGTPDAALLMAGGVAFGGGLVATSCGPYFYGGRICPGGGVAFGGSMRMSTGGSMQMRGGISLGGALGTAGGGAMSLSGGAMMGGGMTAAGSGYLPMRGGVSLGGDLRGDGGGALAMSGGVSLGGDVAPAGGGAMLMSGGVSLGGAISMEGGGVTPPTVYGVADVTTVSGSSVALPLPAYLAGHTLYALIMGAATGQSYGTPSGWSVVGQGNVSTIYGYFTLYSKVADGSEGSTVTIPITSGFGAGVAFSVANAGAAGAGGLKSDTSIFAISDVFAVPADGTLLLGAWYQTDGERLNGPSGWTLAATDLDNAFFDLWYQEDAGAIGTDFVSGSYDDPAQYAVVVIIIEPA